MVKLLLLALLLAPLSSKAAATETPWSVTALAGQFDDSRFLDILAADGGETGPSYMGAAILGRHLGHGWDGVVWEGEAQLVRHWGKQSHWEKNAALVVYWTRFPWNHWLDTRISFAQGLSRATRRPPLEENTRRLLHYMHADISFSPPGNPRWSLVTRLHHRSGVFGLYGTEGGSNFLTAGLRYRF
ncbi:hypothetical protein HC341_03040 [Aquisalimonas sp. 2447]|uniref:hypothetical protein n=1 Tax=Aquisalimonas sp. 2447 TaxID=2740807 RepID=UPI0014327C96|nr:hypothetical protein [Aquisalimonas sp. 2447]QIT54282.1 hypothetical protein HC341_03040 [Aquisalimonas sp. 2447]